MKGIIKLEQLGIFLLAIIMANQSGFAWWFPVLLLVPDISIAGYLFNSKIGAVFYNLVHHQGVAILVYGAGYLMETHYMELAGAVLLGHSAMDRIFGYGLKFFDSFQNTHLGRIGNT